MHAVSCMLYVVSAGIDDVTILHEPTNVGLNCL